LIKMAKRLKVLISAYLCELGTGSSEETNLRYPPAVDNLRRRQATASGHVHYGHHPATI
jgi:hypothetical protein